MITKTLFGKTCEKAGNLSDNNLDLEYYIITEPLCKDYTDLLKYGIRIRMLQTPDEGLPTEEESEIRDIFYRKQDAEEFLNILIKNKVTPVHLRDVAEEYALSKLRVRSYPES